MVNTPQLGTIDCACLIHGTAYQWEYVDKLYNMLCRHLTPKVRLHVFTESNRPVPEPYIKHELINWGIGGPRKSWWYKLQLFNQEHHCGPLLYFDLDVVIVDNIDWIWKEPLSKFWSVKDFKVLYKSTFQGMNSSIMWWDTAKYNWVWEKFNKEDLTQIMKLYPGDQDYITAVVTHQDLRFFNNRNVKSWRWECLDGGYNFKTRCSNTPGTGTIIEPDTSVLIFHGKPKPDQVNDPVVLAHWK